MMNHDIMMNHNLYFAKPDIMMNHNLYFAKPIAAHRAAEDMN